MWLSIQKLLSNAGQSKVYLSVLNIMQKVCNNRYDNSLFVYSEQYAKKYAVINNRFA